MTGELKSAWAFGSYRRGHGVDGDHPRLIAAVTAIKRELVYLGYDLNPESSRFGPKTYDAVCAFQGANTLGMDGQVGKATANALWRQRIEEQAVPHGWLRAQIHWESGDDPGAEFINGDGSRDRGLIQLNSANNPDDAQVFDPAWSITYLGRFLTSRARTYRGCDVPQYQLAVGSWRTPVGAQDWCEAPNTVPNKDGTWAEKAAYYVSRVDLEGRMGWV